MIGAKRRRRRLSRDLGRVLLVMKLNPAREWNATELVNLLGFRWFSAVRVFAVLERLETTGEVTARWTSPGMGPRRRLYRYVPITSPSGDAR